MATKDTFTGGFDRSHQTPPTVISGPNTDPNDNHEHGVRFRSAI